jgi:hypothetical protein
MANMSIQRSPLRELPLNIIRGKELTPNMRGKVLGMHLAGYKIPFIMVRLKLSHYVVRYTINQDELRNNGHTLPRSGITKSFTPLNERNIL